AIEDPITAGLRGLRVARRVVAVWRFRQAREKGCLAERQFVEGFVEIGQRRGDDTVGTRAEIDLIEVELEDAVLWQRGLDPARKQDLLDLALDRNFVRQQHVLGDLLGDRRGADRAAARV